MVGVKFPLLKDKNKGWTKGNVIWENFFKIDWHSLTLMLVVVLLVLSYNHDIKQCDNVIADPCGFCSESGCYSSNFSSALPNIKNQDVLKEVTIDNELFNVS